MNSKFRNVEGVDDMVCECDRCGVTVTAENMGADVVIHRFNSFEPECVLLCEQCLTTLDEVFKDGDIS